MPLIYRYDETKINMYALHLAFNFRFCTKKMLKSKQ